MAHLRHLNILKRGWEVWNEWRIENQDIIPDLNDANLYIANLRRANLRRANLGGANLGEANLRWANLEGANLQNANLEGAKLEGANLGQANLQNANLEGADLQNANLEEAKLEGANLQRADLRGAKLKGRRTRDFLGNRINYVLNLKGANFSGAKLGSTSIVHLDLSEVVGLDKVVHLSPSNISVNTLALSKGEISIDFLRGCGLTDWEVESAKLYRFNLSNEEIININYKIIDIRTTQAIQINPLFISYSHKDSEFVDRVGESLTDKGVRYWRDIHQVTAGPLEKQVDRAMRLHPTVLLVLSGNSVESDWVEDEASLARELEQELKKHVLCPIALDESWKNCKWPRKLRRQIEKYGILDFSQWVNEDEFSKMFSKLLNGLDLFYKEPE